MELFPTQTSAEENGTARKLEEKNLLGKLEGNSGDDSGVDCTLSLRFPPGSGGRKDMGSSSSSSYSKLVFGYCNANAMHGGGYTKAGHAIRTVNVTPIFVRKCLVCGTTETPLWRNGPHGHKSLCNACGIRFKKVEMKALMDGIVNSPEKPNGGHGKSGQEIRRTTKKPKYQFAPNSTPQL